MRKESPSPIFAFVRLFVGILVLFVVILGLWIYFHNSVDGGFASFSNFERIAAQTAIVGFAAIGMTFIIISGMIDLSVGSVVALVTLVIAWTMRDGLAPAWCGAAGIAAGALCGLLNGALVTALRVSPFIVTLGSLLIFRGIAKFIGNEQKIDAPMTWLNDLLARLSPSEQWMLFPKGVWILIAAAVFAAGVLHMTIFGRNAIAVGSNEMAARLAGVNIGKTRLGVFVFAGIFIGLAGLMQFARLDVGDPTVAQGLELDVIAAAVIGGASLSGGEGSIVGSLLGAFMMATIRAGCSQMGLDNWVQEIVTGGIIVAAVTLDRFRATRQA